MRMGWVGVEERPCYSSCGSQGTITTVYTAAAFNCGGSNGDRCALSITCALVMGRVLLLVLVLNADVRGALGSL